MRTALLYVLMGAVWIFLSDRLVEWLAPDRATINRWEMGKGWLFVTVTGGLLYFGLRQQLNRLWDLGKVSEEAIEARLKLESRLSKISSVAPGVIHTFRAGTDGHIRFDFVSGRIEEILGISAAHLMSDASALIAAIHEEDRPGVVAAIEISRVNLTPYHEEHRIRHPQRGLIWLEVSSTPEREADGSTVWHGFLQEITARRGAEAKERETAGLLTAVVNGIPDAIYVKDLEGRYRLFNEAAARFLGKRVEEVLGRKDAEIFDAKSAASIEESDQRVLKTGQTTTYEETLITAGGPHTFLSTKTLHRDNTGKILGIMGVSLDISDRKRAEMELIESEERLRLAMRAANLGTWDWDIAHDHIHWSDEVGAFFGREPGSVPLDFALFRDSLDERDRERVLREIDDAVRDGAPYATEFRIQQPEGKTVWVSSIGQVMRDENQTPVRMVGIHLDISERKEAELKASRLVAIVESSNDAIIGKDVFGVITSWNRGAQKVFGYEAAEMIGTSITRLIPEDRLSEEDFILDKIRRGESVEHFETQRLTKDGRRIHVSVTASPIRESGGRVIGASKIARDITETKRAEVALRESEERLNLVLQATGIGTFEVDLEKDACHWNDVEFELLGIQRGDALEKPETFINFIHPSEREEMQTAWKDALRTGTYNKEFRIVRADGTVRWLAGKGRFLFHEEGGETGKPWRFLGINFDITERKELEAQFLRAQRFESIGTLAAGIAHDLNNVLAPIMLSLEVLRMRTPDAQTRELLAMIDSSAQHGAEMVRQILLFARGAEGNRVEVQVRLLMGELEKIAHDTFPKNIVVRSTVPGDLWPVLGDPTQIHQMLLNLCVNSRDAMPEGGVLTLSARNVEAAQLPTTADFTAKPGRYVCIEVSDTGTGMPAAVKERAFDPFFTTKDIGKGSGLGLSTTMALIKSHRGVIRLESTVGEGTKFELYFPAVAPVAAPAPVATAPAATPGTGQVILLVDDEAAIRAIAQATLAAFGYGCLLAKNGTEALEIFTARKAEIALVLTDMMMPEMDGLATIRALRQLDGSVPIIAASGLLAADAAAEARSLGVKHFLLKPYRAAQLLETLRAVLSEER